VERPWDGALGVLVRLADIEEDGVSALRFRTLRIDLANRLLDLAQKVPERRHWVLASWSSAFSTYAVYLPDRKNPTSSLNIPRFSAGLTVNHLMSY